MTNHCGSARSSISSTGTENGITSTSVSKKSTNGNQKNKTNRTNASTSTNEGYDSLLDNTNEIPINSKTTNKKNARNVTDRGTNSFTAYDKLINNDDTLILRICDLENTTGRRSSSGQANGLRNGDTTALPKTKHRTKTEPLNPIATSPKLKQQRRSSSTFVHSNSTQKAGGSPRISLSHNSSVASKCNCSRLQETELDDKYPFPALQNFATNHTGAHSKATSSGNHYKTKSVGTQHDANGGGANLCYDPWIKQSDAAISSTSSAQRYGSHNNAKVIVITDDFKKKALNQDVRIDSKRKILKYMKTNKSLGSSRSMDDVCIDNGDMAATGITDDKSTNDGRKIVKTKTATTTATADNIDTDPITPHDKTITKAISKSFDNISLLSTEIDVLDNVGSVELIFISDEFLNKVNQQDVIVLKNNGVARSSALKCANGGTTINDKQIVVVSDHFRRKSIQDQKIVIVDKPRKSSSSGGGGGNSDHASSGNTTSTSGKAHPKLNRQSSGESSVDDVNNKITSRAFQSYDEETENLESKDIKTAVQEETEILL